MDFIELAKQRYSVRKFTGEPVPEDKLREILYAGKIAPTAVNAQAFRVYVIRSREGLERINSLSRCIFGSSTVLMVAADTDREWHNPYEEDITSGQQDASIVAVHMMLRAWELGIGSCWVNVFPNMKTAREFGLPENIRPVLLMPLGFAAPEAVPNERHTVYRDDKELFGEL